MLLSRCLKDDIRELAYCLARGNYPVDFLSSAIVGLTAGWRAFTVYGHFSAHSGRSLAPSGIADSSQPASPAPSMSDSSRPASPVSPLCNRRARRHARRQLAREATTEEQAAALADAVEQDAHRRKQGLGGNFIEI